MGRPPCLGDLLTPQKPRQFAKKLRGSRPVFLLSHPSSKSAKQELRGPSANLPECHEPLGRSKQGWSITSSIVATVSRAWRGQTEFQVNLKLGLTPRSPDPKVPPRSPWCGALGPGEIQEPSRGKSGQPPSASREIWVALFVPRLHSDIVLLRRWSP